MNNFKHREKSRGWVINYLGTHGPAFIAVMANLVLPALSQPTPDYAEVDPRAASSEQKTLLSPRIFQESQEPSTRARVGNDKQAHVLSSHNNPLGCLSLRFQGITFQNNYLHADLGSGSAFRENPGWGASPREGRREFQESSKQRESWCDHLAQDLGWIALLVSALKAAVPNIFSRGQW